MAPATPRRGSPIARTAAVAALAVALAACGGARLQSVSGARWRAVPAGERASIDRSHQARLAAATTAEQRAEAALAAARLATRDPAPGRQPEVAPPAAFAGDADAVRGWREQERARRGALDQIDRRRAAWLQARTAWRARRLDEARIAVTMVRCEHQLARAHAVDDHTTWDDDWDVTPYRGQLATVQVAWYRSGDRVAAARRALATAGAALADAKEAYARVVRGAPTATAALDGPTPRDAAGARHRPVAGR
jgi:hypothetical protein